MDRDVPDYRWRLSVYSVLHFHSEGRFMTTVNLFRTQPTDLTILKRNTALYSFPNTHSSRASIN